MLSVVAAICMISPASMGQSWKSYAIAPCRLSISLPGKPVKLGIKMTDDTKSVKKSEWYMYRAGSLSITVSYTEYVKGVAVDLKEAIGGALMGLKQSKSAQKFTTSEKTSTLSGLPARRMQTTFLSGETKAVYSTVVAGKGVRLWQCIASYESTPTNAAIAAKAMASIQLKP